VEEFGYGTVGTKPELECQYYLLDDNRLYRRTEPPLPTLPKAKPKANSLKAQAARRRERASKRRKTEESEASEVEEEQASEQPPTGTDGAAQGTPAGADADTLGRYKWECVAISLTDYQKLIGELKKTRDPNEKILRQRLIDEVIPTIEAAEERQRRKIERRERELMAMEKMVHAKRSSRIADKMDREKREHEAAEAERKRAADLAAAHREMEKQDQMEQERQSRMMTREQRIKDREYKRILAEEELVRAAEEQKQIEEGHARGSERQLKERIAKNKKELEDLSAEEQWTFDCSGCGVHGKNLDDGSHSVACEKCNVWQHSKCLGVSKIAAEKDDFHFVCDDCKRKEERANQPKISLKFKVSSSPAPLSPARVAPSPQKSNVRIEVPLNARPPSQGSMMNGSPYPPSASPPYTARPPHQYPPLQPNGYPYTLPTSQSPAAYPPPGIPQQYPRAQSNSSSPPPMTVQQSPYPANYHGQQWAPIQYTPTQYPPRVPYPQQPYQQQPHPSQPRPPSSQGIPPRPPSSHTQLNGQPTPAARLPSPVINRPIMSPSQGNYDVGPVAGIPQRTSFPPNNAAAHLSNGISPSLQRSHPHQTPMQYNRPTSSSSSSSPHHQPIALSGASPTKPLPPPSNVPMKMSVSPPLATPSVRSVSGTPIIPPTEKLRPSPELLSRSGMEHAMPTPSKVDVVAHATAAAATEAEVRASLQGNTAGEANGTRNGDVEVQGKEIVGAEG
jgi:PHD-finger